MTDRSKEILLTGATGFLGAYMLKDLLYQTDVQIYCLIRPDESASVEKRLMKNLEFLFGREEIAAWPKERIVPIDGDVGKERLGLSPGRYEQLSENVAAVFHSAAVMQHFGNMDFFKGINVRGVERLLSFARTGKCKALNHVSTLAVSGRRCDNPENRFTESDFHKNLDCPNVYVETKYEAEKLLIPFMSGEEDIKIFRPGFIMGDSVSGRFKEKILTDAQYLHLRGHVLMKIAPPLYPDDFMDITPVDYASKAMVHIALNPDSRTGVYHICNPRPILKSEIWEIIRDYGYPVRTLPSENYMENILTQDETDDYLEGLKNVIVYLGDYEKSPAVFDCQKTLHALKHTGIRCPEPDRSLLRKYLDYCVDIGFLPEVEAGNRKGLA